MSLTVKELVCRVRDEMIAEGYASDPRDINSGNCDAFADRLVRLISEHFSGGSTHSGEREICDYFKDREGSGLPLVREKLLLELPNMVPPADMTWDQLDLFIERAGMGWGLHVFVVHNGKAYDSETPEGVHSFFDLPLFQRFFRYYADKYGPLNALERLQSAPGL